MTFSRGVGVVVGFCNVEQKDCEEALYSLPCVFSFNRQDSVSLMALWVFVMIVQITMAL